LLQGQLYSLLEAAFMVYSKAALKALKLKSVIGSGDFLSSHVLMQELERGK